MTSTASSSDAAERDRERMREEEGKNGWKTEESQKIKPFDFRVRTTMDKPVMAKTPEPNSTKDLENEKRGRGNWKEWIL